jgi:outer membrane protein assembly factor BamB
LKTDAAGNLLASGGFTGTVNFGGGDLVGGAGRNGFVASFAPDGSHRWSIRIPAGYPTAVPGASGEIFLSAASLDHGVIDFGGGPVACPSWADMMIGGLAPDRSFSWSRRLGGSSDADRCTGVVEAADAASRIFVCGEFWGSVDLGGGTVGSGESNMFVEVNDADGTYLWERHFGPAIPGGSPPTCADAAIDPAGNIVLVGFYSRSTDLGGGPVTSAAVFDGLLASFTIDGAHRWSRGMGSSSIMTPQGLVVLPDGSVVAMGNFRDTANLDGHVLTSRGQNDVFLARLAD